MLVHQFFMEAMQNFKIEDSFMRQSTNPCLIIMADSKLIFLLSRKNYHHNYFVPVFLHYFWKAHNFMDIVLLLFFGFEMQI